MEVEREHSDRLSEIFASEGGEEPEEVERAPASIRHLAPADLPAESAEFRLGGKQLAILMIFALPGTGTTGFSQLVATQLRQLYPGVYCEVQRSEDAKALIFQKLREKNPTLGDDEVAQLGQQSFMAVHFSQIEDFIVGVGKRAAPLSVLILAKNYTFRTAQRETEMVRRFVEGRLQTRVFAVHQQDGVRNPPFRVESGRYVNIYPFSGFFLVRCLKKIMLRKSHVSFQTDAGIEFVKKFSNAVGFHRNARYTFDAFLRAGLDGGLPYDFASQSDQEKWDENARELKRFTKYLHGVLQSRRYIDEQDCWKLKDRLGEFQLNEEASSLDELRWEFKDSMKEKVNRFVSCFIESQFAEIVRPAALLQSALRTASHFPSWLLHRSLRRRFEVSRGASDCLSAAIEFVAHEVLVDATAKAKASRTRRLLPQHVHAAIALRLSP